MSLSTFGENTSEVEGTNISTHGIWLLVRDREYFMAYTDFPWFKEQPVKAIVNVVEESPNHFYWPDLDVDLTDEIIEHPERFPNIAKQNIYRKRIKHIINPHLGLKRTKKPTF